MDRSKAPKIQAIEHLELPEVPVIQLDNGIPVYMINLGTQDVLKLEVVFYAGRPYEQKPLAAQLTARMIREGSVGISSMEVAEQLDYYGSSISIPYQLDTATFSMHTLGRHLEPTLQLLAALLQQPVFPERELENYKERSSQRLQVDLQKSDVLAYRQITEDLYGSTHPYGYNSTAEMYRNVQREDLLAHYQATYRAGNCQLFVSGKIGPEVPALLNRYLGQGFAEGTVPEPEVTPAGFVREARKVAMPDSLQNAIRLARPLFRRDHPDYHQLYLLNTVLGGYFGSRLMENLREEKGYTYNVYSSIDCMRYDGLLMIASEVGTEFTAATLSETYQEMERLQTELISDNELDMVKNYTIGTFLSMLDGPFNVSDAVRTLITENMTLDFFREALQQTLAADAETLREMARTYLRREDFHEIIVGR